MTVRQVIIPFASVTAIEKKCTALVVPNAIEVTARVDDGTNGVKVRAICKISVAHFVSLISLHHFSNEIQPLLC